MYYIITILYRLDLKTETWGKEINEIINYDSKELFEGELKINSSGSVYRLHNRIFYMNSGTDLEDYEKLLSVNKKENRYEFNFNNYEFDNIGNMKFTNSAWFLLKKSRMKDKFNKYRLKKGDIIKIGRIYTKIKDIKFQKDKKTKKEYPSFVSDLYSNHSKNSKNGNSKLILNEIDNLNDKKESNNKKNKIYSLANQRNSTDPNMDDKIQILGLNVNNDKDGKEIKDNKIDKDNKINEDNNKIKYVSVNNNINTSKNDVNKIEIKSSKKSRICRICYLEEESEMDDPLVQPCKCSGSLKYIHLKCLKHWIMTRSCQKVEESEFCNVFLFKEVECEICKMKLPDLVNHKGKYHFLLDFSDVFKNYLILETITLDEEGNKFIYVISLANKHIKIGRGILSDILLSDVSVSRIHCIISVEGNNAYLKDNDSKFGTLLLIQTPTIKMTENLPLYIQVGRTFLNFEIKFVEENCFSCCGINENTNTFYYHMQNDKQIKLNSALTVKTDFDNDEEEEDIKKEDEIKDEIDKNNKEEVVIVDSNEDESIKIIIENE